MWRRIERKMKQVCTKKGHLRGEQNRCGVLYTPLHLGVGKNKNKFIY
jgi:hypothetical protein